MCDFSALGSLSDRESWEPLNSTTISYEKSPTHFANDVEPETEQKCLQPPNFLKAHNCSEKQIIERFPFWVALSLGFFMN